MFAIGDRKWPGVSKLVEEIGELGQVAGKLMGSRGDIKHWSGNLWDMMHDEIGDVLGAIRFIVKRCKLDEVRIATRADHKFRTFESWHLGDPEMSVGHCDGCTLYSANLREDGANLVCGTCARGKT